jgi:hypothetical protein
MAGGAAQFTVEVAHRSNFSCGTTPVPWAHKYESRSVWIFALLPHRSRYALSNSTRTGPIVFPCLVSLDTLSGTTLYPRGPRPIDNPPCPVPWVIVQGNHHPNKRCTIDSSCVAGWSDKEPSGARTAPSTADSTSSRPVSPGMMALFLLLPKQLRTLFNVLYSDLLPPAERGGVGYFKNEGVTLSPAEK